MPFVFLTIYNPAIIFEITLFLLSSCFRYAKVSDVLTRCTIGSKQKPICDESYPFTVEKVYPFIGQVGPIYLFGDILSSEQIKGVHYLGPSYMYSFLGDEVPLASDNSLYSGIFDAKDGLSARIIFGLNAQVFFFFF